jgi:predicted XRE-type DNA-binding protein
MEQLTKTYTPEIESKYDFNEGFKLCCKVCRKRVREDYDAVIGITGDEGVGKSTCANQLGFGIDDNYTLEKNVLYSPNKENMKNAIQGLPRFSAINGDEAIKILYKLKWWSPLQLFMNTFYRLCREENKISIFPMPRFSDFNEGFRNHRIKIWIYVLDRGLGVAFEKDWSPFSKDPWWMDENQKMIDKYRLGKKMSSFTLEKKLQVLQKSRNFLDVITFPDLDPEKREMYKQFKQQHTYEGIEEEYSEGDRYVKIRKKSHRDKKLLIEELLQLGYSHQKVADILRVSRSAVSQLVSSKVSDDI